MSIEKSKVPPAKGNDGVKAAAKSPQQAPAKGPTATPAPTPAPQPPRLFRNIDWLTFGITTLFVWIGYYLTLAPNLGLEDSGELAVGSFYAGIPHPPGYPVWTLYTWVWTLLPISNVAWRVALGSATAGALTSGLLGLLVSRGSSMMMEGVADLKNIDRRWESAICVVAGFVAGGLFGFNGYMWSQSVIVEVYSLSALSLISVMLFLLRWVYAPNQYRYLYLAFFMHGICFNNHQSLLVVVLGMEALILAVDRKMARQFFFWNTVVFIAVLALSLMGYVGIMTSNTPVFVIFILIGLGSAALWVWLSIDTKLKANEFIRDIFVVGVAGVAVITLAIMTNWIYLNNSTAPTFLLILVEIGLIYGLVHFAKLTKMLSRTWVATLGAGGAWALGTAMYLYMPLAGMTNPPMQWGYPRTVEGFFHAFTRGQYEKIHPTSGEGANIIAQTVSFVGKYANQLWSYMDGMFEEFSLVYLLIALVMFLFYRRMQKRERAWVLGVAAIFITLGPFLVILLNPPADRQAKELIRVFFTASHLFVAMAVGYGLTLISATMATQYERFRIWFIYGGLAAAGVGLYTLVKELGESMRTGLFGVFGGLITAFAPGQYAMPVHADLIVLGAAVVFVIGTLLWKQRAPLALTLVIFAIMPLHSIMSHWFDNEQRGHLFGYWFGHDMFTPPFVGPDGKFSYDPKVRAEMMKDPEKARLIYPEMTRDAILYGGTDPGRFCPTYMIFDESFIPPRCKEDTDPNFDRRDVYIITQNALADGTYLNYIRAHYNRSEQLKYDSPFFQELLRGPAERDPLNNYKTNFIASVASTLLDKPLTALGARIEARRRAEGVYPRREMYIATPDDSQRCFKEYLDDAQERLKRGQLKPGEDVKVVDNRVQVSGQVAVMSINGLLTKVMFEKNPTNEFFVEESFPLDWMYPHLTPFGVIMKINRQPLPSLPEDVYERDHAFWSKYSERLIGNWITYDTPVSNIVQFAEKLYLKHNFSGFKGDPKFARDDQAQKAFSKLRSSIGGVYAWRIGPYCLPEFRPKSADEARRLYKEADFTFRQAFAFCPYSPEAVFRYINLLIQPPPGTGIEPRLDDALMIARTCQKLDPNNGQVAELIGRLDGFKKNSAQMDQARAALQQMEDTVKKNPTNFEAALQLAGVYMQMQQPDQANVVLDGVLNNPAIRPDILLTLARIYAGSQNWGRLEMALEKWSKINPEAPEAWFELARFKATFHKPTEALTAVSNAITLGKQRRATDPKGRDFVAEARVDTNFVALRAMPEFQKLIQ